MICAQCKNEKWDQTICPNCGMGEREALLVRADHFRKMGHYSMALEFYNKALSGDPENVDILMQKTNCLYLEAISRREKYFFDQASDSFERVLQIKWNWEKGHQLRVDLFLSFGRLDELAKKYEKIIDDGGSGKKTAQNMVKIIYLSKKFKESLPEVIAKVDSTGEWMKLFKSFWLLPVGLPALLWLAYKFASEPHSREEGNAPALFLVLMIIALIIILVIFIGMKLYRGNQKKEKEGNRIA